MNGFSIQYTFTLDNGARESFDVLLDAETLEIRMPVPDTPPPWTELPENQCGNCPLVPDSHPFCPLALNLANIVDRFDGLMSHEKVMLSVKTAERTITQNTSAQQGLSSLMGLVIAGSGCPHAAFFRPMARFHLPLASEEETAFRAASMYLLAQYFRSVDGQAASLELSGLKKIYANMQIVNTAVANRLRQATCTDSALNAIIILDLYATSLTLFFDEALDSLKPFFRPYLAPGKPGP